MRTQTGFLCYRGIITQEYTKKGFNGLLNGFKRVLFIMYVYRATNTRIIKGTREKGIF